jgi:hypothetical protein
MPRCRFPLLSLYQLTKRRRFRGIILSILSQSQITVNSINCGQINATEFMQIYNSTPTVAAAGSRRLGTSINPQCFDYNR